MDNDTVISIKCFRCKEDKPEEEFYRSPTKVNGRQSTCKLCDKLRVREHRKANREHYRVKGREAYRKYAYGITPDEVNQMMVAQDCKCLICSEVLDDRVKGDSRRKQVVDHCHDTGKIRGLLCNMCNQALGLFKDSPEILEQAIKYLKRNK